MPDILQDKISVKQIAYRYDCGLCFSSLLPRNIKFIQSQIKLKVGNTIDINKLVEKLFDLGYRKETTVNMTGEIATRGYVIDIFPINSDNPVRIEFWGDEIDSIRTFNVENQLTISKINEVDIFPNTETLLISFE